MATKIDVSQYKKFKRLTLVQEIKSILQKYPDDGQIFKEIIQNADDAGASKLVFIYDENDYRNHGGNYSKPGLKQLQGPSLYAYNDAHFTQSDWDGIRSLGLSNKIKDPLKVGRFGLGFKSVFHLTVDVSQYKKFKRLTLVQEIKSILQKYPDDGQIFKEIIQNADDAGASKLVFIYDENDYRNHGGNYSKPGLKQLQGPSLYAYNDAHFTQSDWDGIRSLGLSNKIKDPLKVGRFGLGFKSVFHLTDLPSIASGTIFAYLDPIAKTFSDELEFLDFSDPQENRNYQRYSDFNQFKNLPGGYFLDKRNGSCNGTLFRFPLRQEKSEISSMCYGTSKFMNLINTFVNDGYMNLLFLKKVQSIKVYKISAGSTRLQELYSLNIADNCIRQYGGQRKRFIDALTEQVLQKNFNILTLNHRVDIEEESKGKKKTYSFMLSEYFGHTRKDEFYDMITDPELSYIPLVAVAMPLNGEDGGHIFCGLPLPMREKCMTGLPVHVNGFFALGPDRKDLKWKSLSSLNSNDKSVNWNLHLISKLLPAAYLTLIKHLIFSNTEPSTVYKSWPDESYVNNKWRMFLDTFYRSLVDVPCIHISGKDDWVEVHKAIFIQESLFDSRKQFLTVSKFLTSAKKNIAQAPKHVRNSFATTFINYVNKETIIDVLKKNFNVFFYLGAEDKCSVLSHCIHSDNDLKKMDRLQILPTVGGTYRPVYYKSSKIDNICIPTKAHPKDILPSQKNVLDTSFFVYDVAFLQRFKEIASTGKFNLLLLDDVRTTLRVIKENLPDDWRCATIKVHWPDQPNYPSKDWLSHFWKYQRRENISLHDLEGIPLIPVGDGTQRYLCKLSATPIVVSNSYKFYGHSKALEPSMNDFLMNCGALFVNENYIDTNALQGLCSKNKVLTSDANGIINAIENLNNLGLVGNIMNAVKSSTEKQKRTLQNVIGDFVGNLPDVIKELNIFQTHQSWNYVSLNRCILVDKNCIPEVWNAAFGNLLTKQSISHNLGEKLKYFMTGWIFEDIINCMLDKIKLLNIGQQDKLFNFCMKYMSSHDVSRAFINNLRSYLYVKSDETRLKPSDLFERKNEFQDLFYQEKHKFPLAKYDIDVLKKLGLKTKLSEVTMQDVVTSICSIQNICNSNEEHILRKVQMILQVSQISRFNLSSYKTIPWIPIQKVRPLNYPNSLSWLGADQCNGSTLIQPPNNVVTQNYAHLIGSKSYVAHSSISDLLPNLSVIPDVLSIVSHLKCIVDSYSDDEKGSYKSNTYHIYTHLAQCNISQIVNALTHYGIKIWQGKCFVDSGNILLKETTVNVSPYYHHLPNDFPDSFKKVVSALGCGQKDECSIYIDVLSRIKIKHEKSNKDLVKDMDLTEKLTRALADQFHMLSEEQKQLVCVPVDCNNLKLCCVKECFFHDFDGTTSYDSVRTHNILHRCFEEEVASKFGISDLTSVVLAGEENSMFKPWGQHEALTLRLSKLLKDYEDGMAIPKELIQNADDAGASEVFFLYDRRENEQLKSKLFDKNMKSWQGPALWVYNNALFTKEDFENITKLNSGTKEFDTTKIGRYGLGFNAVYHLTDVPSFLSGDNMVVFDPHTTYLGKALRNNNPGLLIRMRATKRDLVNFNDQFKLFHGVFGVHLDFSNSDVKYFDGTLFRLPLRKYNEAQKSEIKNMEYSRTEIEKLFQKFEEYLDHLLLFTVNVKTVKVYQLDEGAQSPSEMKILFEVHREDTSSNSTSIMRAASSVLKKMSSQRSHTIPVIESSETMNVKVIDRRGKVEKNWLTSSCIGSQKSFIYASNHKGFNPCGGVALEYAVESNGKINIASSTKQRFVYCFLPLPERSKLPVHVNGAFQVSNDRKQLAQRSIDQKDASTDSDWNVMLGSDIGHAYFNLLLKVKKMYPDINMKQWIKIFPSFPLPHCKPPILKVVTSLLHLLVNTDEALFPLDSGWKKWKDIRILSSEFDAPISCHAISYLNWYYRVNRMKTVCANIPQLASLFQRFEFHQIVENQTIFEESFIEMFFQLIDHCHLDDSLRNEILHCLLAKKSDSGKLKDLFLQRPCIPTKPNGKLRIPSELIRHGSKAAALYDVNEEVFPIDMFCHHSNHLETLGMDSSFLSWEKIVNRAQTIERISVAKDFPTAKERSKKLAAFISDELGRFQPSIEVVDSLLKTPFIPLKQKSQDSLLCSWKNENYAFGAPSTLLESQYVNIACFSSLICDNEYDSLLRKLKCNKKPTFEVVKEQIVQLIAAYEGDERKGIDVSRVFDDIYKYLQPLSIMSSNELSSMKLVYTKDGKLIYPSQAYFKISHEISDYIYELPTYLQIHFPELMIGLGVAEKCGANEYVKLLVKIKEEYQDASIPEGIVTEILHKVIPFLCLAEVDAHVDLFLPDHLGVLRSASEMCFKEVYWLPHEDNVCYSHDEIPPVTCQHLKIKPSRSDYFQRKSVGIPFGQHEDLTTRIKNLLKGYSDAGDVLKEILQNADDAGATAMHLTLDLRMHGTEKIFSDKWKSMQGPALLVANNGVFSEQDLKAIQALGVGSKSKEPLKTGKYGVGFNAVYAITDCPSFLTNIAGSQEDVLVMFDPNLEYAEGATKEEPGIMFKNARMELGEKYTDVKTAYLIDEFDSAGMTLFRFPLRNKEMAAKSKLSENITEEKEVKEMLDKLKEHVPGMLIFLRNIKKLTFKYISSSSEVQEENFVAQTYGVTEKKIREFQSYQKTLASKLGNVTSVMKFTKALSYNICIKHTSAKGVSVCHFDVVEQCGFNNMKQLDQSIKKIIDTNELCLIPKGAIASRSKDTECEICEDAKEKESVSFVTSLNNIFCSLPLPLSSGLDVLINGHFILDYETRRSLWSNESMTVERLWNNAILQHCVLPCYLTYLQSKVDDLSGSFEHMDNISIINHKIDRFYNLFPHSVDAEKTTDYWNVFNISFYKHVFQENLPFLAVYKVVERDLLFCKPQEQFLLYRKTPVPINHTYSGSPEQDKRPPLLKILQQVHIESDILPEKVSNNFELCEAPLAIVTPEEVRNKLIALEGDLLPDRGSRLKVEETAFKTSANVVTVLRYCLSDCKETADISIVEGKNLGEYELTEEKDIKLSGLPLCLLANDELVAFSDQDPKYFTCHNRMFANDRHLFVRLDVYHAVLNKELKWKDMACFKEFTLDGFVELLKDFLPESTYAVCDYQIPLAEPVTEHWLKLVWRYFKSLQEDNMDAVLEKVGSWSLLLTKRDSSQYLLPSKRRKGVLYLMNDLRDSTKRVIDVLRTSLKIFQPACTIYDGEDGTEIYSEKIATQVFGTINKATDLTDALVLNADSLKTLKFNDFKIVLKHLGTMHKSIDASYASKLKELLIFEKWDESIAAAKGNVVVLSSDIPCIGLETIETQNHCMFLKRHSSLDTLYERLGFVTCNFYSFYLDYVFPSIQMLTDDAVYNHMSVIKDCLHRNIYLEKDSKEDVFQQKLRELKFISTEDGGRRSAAELYDPKRELFQLMINKKDFPSDIYCKNDWLLFLREIGLIVSVSQKLFIQFAKKVADDINDDSLKISKLLCQELFSSDTLLEEDFLHIVKSIEFIIPNKVKKSWEVIYRSENSIHQKICFNDSVYHSCANLVWTKKAVLPKYAQDCLASLGKDKEKYYSSILGIKKAVSPDPNSMINYKDILDHIKNITEVDMKKKTESCKILDEKTAEDFVAILTSFYEYIYQRHDILGEERNKQYIKSMSCILVDEDRRIEKPGRTVLSDDYTIVPYINVISEKHGKYFDIFRALGCCKNPTALQYCDVIQEVKSEVMDNVLNVNQVTVVKKAVCYLSGVLQTKAEADTLKNVLLYLPTITFQTNIYVHLTLSSEAIFVDDLKFENRLKQFDKPVLMPKYDLVKISQGMEVNVSLSNYLPKNSKPMLLSNVIEEKLVSEVQIRQVKNDHISKKIETRLQSEIFLECFMRLLKHEAKSDLADDSDQTLLKQRREEICNAIQKVKVFVLPVIKTQYVYNDVSIPGSEYDRSLFLRKVEDSLEIYFDITRKDDNPMYLEISSCLLDLFNAPLKSKTTILLVPMLLQEPLEELPRRLDEQNIFRDEHDSDFLNSEQTPIPGHLVPLELYCLLKNDFVDFDKGEFVALERDQGGDLVYIYAVIRRVDYKKNKLFRVYGVQVSADEEDIIDIRATDLYRFDRKATAPLSDDRSLVLKEGIDVSDRPSIKGEEEAKTFEEITEEIRKIIRDINDLPEDEQKKVIRRLYLKWHPDKHPEHMKELATEVFKFIQNEVERMKRGYKEFFPSWNRRAYRESRSYEDYFTNFNRFYRGSSFSGGGRSRRRGGGGGGTGGGGGSGSGCSSRSGYFSTPPTFQKKNPQPSEAKKWFKQAQYDISSAEDDNTNSYEWTCYKAYQASLIALKAAQYLIDFNNDEIDDITTIASALSDVDLLTLATEMETLLGAAVTMLYPNRVRPSVPHDRYSRVEAQQAISIAKQILQIVEQRIQSNEA